MRSFPRLYAILDIDVLAGRGLEPEDVVAAWLDAGVTLVQLRAKGWGSGPCLRLADRLTKRTLDFGAALIVNDRADVARLSGAAGVHVGQDDLSVPHARAIVGTEAIVGLSTHTDTQVAAAIEAPIDYLAIGPVFGTISKERPDPVVGLDGVRRAAASVSARGISVVAIGGITLERAPDVIAAGASAVAVISDLLPPDNDAFARARAFVAALGA